LKNIHCNPPESNALAIALSTDSALALFVAAPNISKKGTKFAHFVPFVLFVANSAAKSTFRMEGVEGEGLMDEVKTAGSKAPSDPGASVRKARLHPK